MVALAGYASHQSACSAFLRRPGTFGEPWLQTFARLAVLWQYFSPGSILSTLGTRAASSLVQSCCGYPRPKKGQCFPWVWVSHGDLEAV